MKVTVIYDRQNSEIVGVYSDSVAKVRKSAISMMTENVDSRDEAESMVDEDLEIESYTVEKHY